MLLVWLLDLRTWVPSWRRVLVESWCITELLADATRAAAGEATTTGEAAEGTTAEGTAAAAAKEAVGAAEAASETLDERRARLMRDRGVCVSAFVLGPTSYD